MRSRKSLLLLLCALLSSCAEPTLYPQGSLADQILVARHGRESKLTNQTCLKYVKGVCAQESLIEYDLGEKAFRDKARNLGFVCKVGGKQYKICADQPGFCRTTYTCNWFQHIFGGCHKNVEYLPASPTSTLIDEHLKCFAESQYDWDQM